MPADVEVSDHGTVVLFALLSEAAENWAQEHLPEDRMTYGGAVAVEHRYAMDIIDGMAGDGLILSI
jgi:predicted thioesterase